MTRNIHDCSRHPHTFIQDWWRDDEGRVWFIVTSPLVGNRLADEGECTSLEMNLDAWTDGGAIDVGLICDGDCVFRRYGAMDPENEWDDPRTGELLIEARAAAEKHRRKINGGGSGDERAVEVEPIF